MFATHAMHDATKTRTASSDWVCSSEISFSNFWRSFKQYSKPPKFIKALCSVLSVIMIASCSHALRLISMSTVSDENILYIFKRFSTFFKQSDINN